MPTSTARIRRLASLTVAGLLLASACSSAPAPDKTPADATQEHPAATAATAPKPAETAAEKPAEEPRLDATVASAPGAPPAAAGAAVSGGYVFSKKAPGVGAKALEKESKALDMNLSIALKAGAKAEKMAMVETTTIERTVEILAASGDTITKIKVSYKTHDSKRTKNGKAEPEKAKLAGKTYIVESKDGATTVTTTGGAAAPDEEAKAVKKEFKSLGRPDTMSKALPDTPIKVGDRVDSIAQALKDRFNEDESDKEKVTVEKAVVTFSAVKDTPSGKVGVFDYAFDLAVDNGLMIIKMPAKGQAELRIEDAMPVRITMKSDLAISSSGGGITGTGKADMSLTREPK